MFESRAAKGGTWDLFRYPGVRSDSDMFTFGYTWRPWQSDIALADGPLIREYIDTVAEEYDVDRLIRYQHRITRAAWDSEKARWTVTATVGDPGAGETITLTASFLWSCAGYYQYEQGFQPTWPGMADFQGEIVHPQHWPEDLDYTGKRVVVIGSGATAVTLVPAMAPRGRARDDAAADADVRPHPRAARSRRPAAHRLRMPDRVRLPGRAVGQHLQAVGFYKFSMRWPGRAKAMIRKSVEPAARRVWTSTSTSRRRTTRGSSGCASSPTTTCSRCSRSGDASVVTDTIETFTPGGLRLASGKELPADVVVTATGFQMQLPFGGIDFVVDGEPMDLPSKIAYKALMLSDVPNFFFTLGYTNASWTLKADLVIDYVCRLLAHLDQHDLRTAVPVPDPALQRRPLMLLSSGYIQRSAHLLPSEGDRAPWRLEQNYLVDRKVINRAKIDDGVLRFT